MTLFSIYKQNRLFFAGYLVLVIFALFILLGYSKVESHLLLNPLHYKFLDYVFRGATILGDGIFIIILAVLLWFLKKKYLALMIVGGYLISGIPVQVIKSFIESPRPAIFLKSINYSHFVEGVTLHNYNSFPSGHTASAFALVVILSTYFKNNLSSLLFLLLATAVGYSRIYLSQHFMVDVFVGSLIGVLSGIAAYLFLDKWIRKITEKDKQKTSIE
ncbi:MAG: phosphatase PAP2 family protein [Ginsengibacter sp.]